MISRILGIGERLMMGFVVVSYIFIFGVPHPRHPCQIEFL